MGERITAFDWDRTPLGPIESWSPALRMMTGFLLANRFPMLLWWGPQFIQIYNDAYRPVLGAKHPDPGLGRPLSECWSEIWDVLRPLVETPFNGGPSTWMEDIFLEINRHGFFEETHFTVAYSPVPDDTVPGGIGGVLATVHEITGKVVSERRIALLRELGAHSAEAKTAREACESAAATLRDSKDVPFALFYLVDADRKKARLAAASSINAGADASPKVIPLDSNAENNRWPLMKASETEQIQVVEQLTEKFQDIPCGPWPEPARAAAVVPIRSHLQRQPVGFIIAGLSPRQRYDQGCADFLGLMSTQVATTVANARAYEEERERAEALAELDRAKTTFFSNISHELRTPLTLMLGPIEDELREHPETRPRLEVAHRNSLRLLKLVNTLLDFSRIEAGRVQTHFESVDLAAYTAELASNFRSAMESVGLKFIVDCPPLTEPVQVDREMWEKVVLNLLSNAFKFTLNGSVTVNLRARSGSVELVVSDTGTGIPAAELPRIFERFYRARSAQARTHEGTGIGLALVHELVRILGGEIRVTSVEGKGTVFTVTLPTGTQHLPKNRGHGNGVSQPASASALFQQEAMSWLPSKTGGNKPDAEKSAARPARILVAEDNADMRQYITRLLGDHFAVTAVANGEEALKSIHTERPDLILSDVMMPGLDGLGLLRELRSDESMNNIPIILLSARAGEEARIDGLARQANDYLVKPFSARELLARVSTHLELARTRQESERNLVRLFELEKAARQEAQAVARMKDHFLATLSHELRTPLNPVMLIASDAAENQDLPAEVRAQFEVIRANVEVEARLIDDLLDLSHINHGKVTLKLLKVDAHEVLRESARTLQDQFQARRIHASLELKAPHHAISADAVRLQQVFWNVLKNAIKFSPEGGKISVETFQTGDGKALGVKITDNGIGMTPGELAHVFLPFSQGDQSREKSGQYGGLGLGLAISKKIVELHSGSIRAESNGHNQGTSLIMEFPLATLG